VVVVVVVVVVKGVSVVLLRDPKAYRDRRSDVRILLATQYTRGSRRPEACINVLFSHNPSFQHQRL
jgi:hypothetical protein